MSGCVYVCLYSLCHVVNWTWSNYSCTYSPSHRMASTATTLACLCISIIIIIIITSAIANLYKHTIASLKELLLCLRGRCEASPSRPDQPVSQPASTHRNLINFTLIENCSPCKCRYIRYLAISLRRSRLSEKTVNNNHHDYYYDNRREMEFWWFEGHLVLKRTQKIVLKSESIRIFFLKICISFINRITVLFLSIIADKKPNDIACLQSWNEINH